MVKTIARCTPSLGLTSVWWSLRAESVIWPMNTGKVLFFMQDRAGGEIAECRNALVQRVLDYEKLTGEDITHIWWLDDDVLVSSGALLQLCQHDYPIVSGVYFLKGPVSQPLILPGPCEGVGRFVPDQSYEVWGHGMGLTLVKLEVYKKMGGIGLPLDRYGHPEWYRTTAGRPEDLEVGKEGGVHTGFTEDTYFLDLAHQAGYKSVIDTSKHAFGFHYDAKNHQGYPQEQWKQFADGLAVRWKTKDGEVIWD